MVIKDVWAELPPKKSSKDKVPTLGSADPVDRFAAFVVDIAIVLTPVLLFVVSPFRKGIVYATLLNNELSLLFNAICIVLTIVITLFVYHAASFYFFGNTIGKVFFSLRIVDTWSFQKPKLSQILVRTTVWLAQILGLGFSFLSCFLNERRRGLHDQISDTVLISDSRESTKPNFIERSFAQLIFSILFVLVSSVLLSQLFFLYQGSQGKGAYVSYFEGSGILCAEVTDAQKELQSEEKETQRLEVALGLFGAQVIDDLCLKKEVDHYFRYETIEGLGYLAKSFVLSDSAAQSDAYLAKVCKVDPLSDSCRLSHIVDDWGQKKWAEVKSEFLKPWKEGQLYAYVLAVRHFLNRENFETAKLFLDRIPQDSMFSHFHAIHQAKIHWGLGERIQARTIASAFRSQFDDEQKLSLSQWMCLRETNEGCKNFSKKSCGMFIDVTKSNPVSLKNDKVSSLFIRAKVCEGQNSIYSLAKINKDFSREAHDYIDAMSTVTSGQLDMGMHKLKKIVLFSESKAFKREAFRSLVENSRSEKELNLLVKLWSENSRDKMKKSLGQIILNTSFQRQNFKLVEKIGDELVAQYKLKNEDMKKIISSKYYLGKRQKAWELYKTIIKVEESEGLRAPASLNADKALTQLKIEFGQ